MTALQPKPVGQRPCCLQCGKELQPNFRRERPPLSVKTGRMETTRDPLSYGRSQPTYIETEGVRATTDEERKQWRKDHPPQFLGTYGRYRDNRFCGLNCGYGWAVAHSNRAVQPAK